MCVDRATCFRRIYGLKNLKSSLYNAMHQFLLDCGNPPQRILTDFNSKLFGGKIGKLVRDNNVSIKSSPSYHQHQNGLVERQWQTAATMTCNWLRHSLLPAKFWFCALKRACEVCNILPASHYFHSSSISVQIQS